MSLLERLFGRRNRPVYNDEGEEVPEIRIPAEIPSVADAALEGEGVKSGAKTSIKYDQGRDVFIEEAETQAHLRWNGTKVSAAATMESDRESGQVIYQATRAEVSGGKFRGGAEARSGSPKPRRLLPQLPVNPGRNRRV